MALRWSVTRHHLLVLRLLIWIQNRLDLAGSGIADGQHLVSSVWSRKRGALMQGIQLLRLALQDRPYLLLLIVG